MLPSPTSNMITVCNMEMLDLRTAEETKLCFITGSKAGVLYWLRRMSTSHSTLVKNREYYSSELKMQLGCFALLFLHISLLVSTYSKIVSL